MITTYWSNLQERERWMLALGAGCLAFYLFYLFLYSPLSTTIEAKTRQLKEKQETLIWLEQVQQEPKKKTTVQSLSGPKLLALIGNQLNSKPFRSFPYQLQQTNQGDIQLSFDKVPFNSFLAWLWALRQDYAINLKQVMVERSEPAGVVKLMALIAVNSTSRN